MFFCLVANAEVYWIARSIDLGTKTDKNGNVTIKFLHTFGHSYITVVPDDPGAFALKYNPSDPSAYSRELEVDFGSGKKGFIISAFPVKGNMIVLHSDGNLVAAFNSDLDMAATKDFFASRRSNHDWHFVWNTVEHDGISDTDYAYEIYRLAKMFIKYSSAHRIDYNTVTSMLEDVFIPNEAQANNCNSVAFSLLVYANASRVPDLGAKRLLPGQRNLMPVGFFRGTELRPAGWRPRAIINDDAYRARIKALRELYDRSNNWGNTGGFFY